MICGGDQQQHLSARPGGGAAAGAVAAIPEAACSRCGKPLVCVLGLYLAPCYRSAGKGVGPGACGRQRQAKATRV